MRVVILSKKDFSGSAYKLVEALQKNDICVKLIVKDRNRYKMPVDYCLQSTSTAFLQEIIDRCDVVHFKGDEPPVMNWNGLDIRNKPKIVTVGGSYARRHGDIGEGVCLAEYDISKYFKAQIRTAFTADLNYPEYDGIYTPQTITGEKFLFNYKGKHIIQHSPSSRNKKGTDKYIIPAIEILKQKGYDFEFELLENISNEECLQRKKRGTLFIDQVCSVGWYGISALESMRYGIPIIAHLSEEAIKQSGMRNIAVINTPLVIDILVNTIEKYLNLGSDCKKVAKKTFDYFKKVHSPAAVAKQWKEIYARAMTMKIEQPKQKRIRTYNLEDMNTTVMVRFTTQLGEYKSGEMESMDITTANELAKKRFLEIIKLNDMVKVKILKPSHIDGHYRNVGEVIEVSYQKAGRLALLGDLEVLPFEEEKKEVEPYETPVTSDDIINQIINEKPTKKQATKPKVKKQVKPKTKK